MCIDRLLRLIQSIARRSAYLALLEEHPATRRRLVALFADSALLAERVIAHPLLLDDLFDARLETDAPDRQELLATAQRRLANAPRDDAEGRIVVLQEEKNSDAFRIGLAYRNGNLDAIATARGLSVIADFIVTDLLEMATRDAQRQNGRLAPEGTGEGIGVIGYGSLGGGELGFASDLDLVFVYDENYAQRESDGARSLDGARYYARIAQRIVHWLGMQSQAGRLYDVDVRLRPDGGKGLLVVSMSGFAEYQRDRAWVWEQQALVRARPIAGDTALLERFRALRRTTLAQPRERTHVLEQVGAMRARWRSERDRSTAQSLDLKQGAGALLDIEFLLQALVLIHAHAHPRLLDSGNTATLIARARHAAAARCDAGTGARGRARHTARTRAQLHARCAPATRAARREPACAHRCRPPRLRRLRSLGLGPAAEGPQPPSATAMSGRVASMRCQTLLATVAISRSGWRLRDSRGIDADIVQPALVAELGMKRPEFRWHLGRQRREHRRAGGACLAEHVHRIGRDDDAVGECEIARVRIDAVLVAAPVARAAVSQRRAHAVAPLARRAPRCRDEHAAAVALAPGFDLREQAREPGVVGAESVARATDQERCSRSGELLERAELRVRRREPGVVDRIERAHRLDHVRRLEAVVSRRDHEIVVAAVDARIEDLHRERRAAAGLAQCARKHGRMPAATDRERGPGPAQRTPLPVRNREECGAREIGPDPAPRRAQRDAVHGGLETQRSSERERLALVAGGAVGDDAHAGCASAREWCGRGGDRFVHCAIVGGRASECSIGASNRGLCRSYTAAMIFGDRIATFVSRVNDGRRCRSFPNANRLWLRGVAVIPPPI